MDDFNLFNIKDNFHHYNAALYLILDMEEQDSENEFGSKSKNDMET